MPAEANSNGSLTPLLHAEGPPSHAVDWEHYRVPLTAAPMRRFSATARPKGYELAARWTRLSAALWDSLLMLLPLGIWFYLSQNVPMNSGERALWLGLVIATMVLVGVCQMILLTVRGQSLGKWSMGIRIVRADDNSNPGFWRACALRGVVPGLISAIPVIGNLFALVDILMIFGEKHQCLHDHMADTKVIEA